MNKIAIFFLSHYEKKEIEFSSEFINRTDFIKNNVDIFLHNDNDSYTNEELLQFVKFENFKGLLKTPQNFPIYPDGHTLGWARGISQHYDFLKNYDLVVSLTIDNYIVDENMGLKQIIMEEMESENSISITKHTHQEKVYNLDFFIFKPKKMKNFFSEAELVPEYSSAETWMYGRIEENKISVKELEGRYRKPYPSGNFTRDCIDQFGMIHNHNHKRIISILKGEDDPRHLHEDHVWKKDGCIRGYQKLKQTY